MTTRRSKQRRSQRRPAPREWVIYGTWPVGKLASDAPPGTEELARFSWRLQSAIDRIGMTQLSDRSGISTATIRALLRGERRPRFTTVCALEDALGKELFPRHGWR